PYVPLFDFTEGSAAIKAAFAQLSLDNFRLLVSDSLYISSYLRSLVVAVTSTLILLLIGYPIAYGMARLPQRWQAIAMMLVIIPFWTSFLIRIYAWINILQHDGLLNNILLALHLVSAPVVWLSTDSAMYLGIVYSYLPFMILPLYATLARMDPSLLEAASDLGASPGSAFWLVTFPLSLPGVGAGALLSLPIVILIIYSFNASRLVTVWGGWSLRWYYEFFNERAMLDAAWMSLRVAAVSATIATLLGTLAAVGLVRGERFRGRSLFS